MWAKDDWARAAGAQALDHADTVIYRTSAEIDALAEQGILTPAGPYWGPLLRHSRAARLTRGPK